MIGMHLGFVCSFQPFSNAWQFDDLKGPWHLIWLFQNHLEMLKYRLNYSTFKRRAS